MECVASLLSGVCAARQVAAGKVLSEACNAVGNRDIEPFIPALVSSIARPAEVPDTVHKLSATTFVQARPACANMPCLTSPFLVPCLGCSANQA